MRSAGVYQFTSDSPEPGEPLFDDPAWDEIEAIRATSRRRPTGHISAIMPGRKTGKILCLNTHFTRSSGETTSPDSKVDRVRVLINGSHGQTQVLGEIPLHEDGSFMAEVPADTALGFETLDVQGHVLQRLAPMVWVRPGENRTCLGCHEPYNRSPRNLRPMAVSAPPVELTNPPQTHADRSQ